MKRVTISDIARAADVSRATVSYALNDRPGARMSDATRQLVLSTAESLGYQGSPAARALRIGRGEVVLLLLPDWSTTGELGRVLSEVGRRTADIGLVCLRYEGPDWKGRLRELLGMVTAAAVVTFEPLSPSDTAAVKTAGIPEVRAWLLDSTSHPHTTHIHQSDIVQAQVDHLLERGSASLAFVAATEDRDLPFVEARRGAFRRICAERGLNLAGDVVLSEGVNELGELLPGWIRERHPLGVVAFSDPSAVAVATAAAQCGLSVPEQVKVIGVDDSALATLVAPALTSIHFDLASEAASVAAELADVLSLPAPPPAQLAAPVAVVARAST
ncbi:LacI family DNA-binding transcriptional regulator [Microbacterium sp. AGC62]